MPTADFGAHLPDQLPAIAAAVSAHLSLESDVASFLAELASLERDYAAKRQTLVRKYRDKKLKRDQECAVGPSPTKQWKSEDATTLSSYVSDLFSTNDDASADHVSLASQLDKISTDTLATSRAREEIRKKHTTYVQKLLVHREKVYSDREKAKSKYDELCHDFETHRQKREKADSDDRHAERAARGFQMAENDMKIAKNSYLIQIALSNRAKQSFYRNSLPALENSLQSLWTLTTQKLASSVASANTAVAAHHELVRGRFNSLAPKLERVDADKDQQLFIEHNRYRWQEPGEWIFEPCVGFFDTQEMSTNLAAVTFLQNRLIRCRNRIDELQPLSDAKNKEVAGLDGLRHAYENQEAQGNADEVLDNLFEAKRLALGYEIELHNLFAEVETIVAAIGDNQGLAQPHRFKPASFTIPTSCNLCGGTIWGIAKQGAICKPCGYTVHQKCEMKVPAECKASPGNGRTASASNRTNDSMATSSDAAMQSSPSREATTGSHTVAPVPSSSTYSTINSLPDRSASAISSLSSPLGVVLYTFEASSPFELTVAEGDMIALIEDDVDNCGWIKVKQGNRQGLVPTSYCDFETQAAIGSAAATIVTDSASPQGCGKFVCALYDYAAQDPDQHSLADGERIELTATGFSYGEGWCEGIKAGKVGIFPSNYVQSE